MFLASVKKLTKSIIHSMVMHGPCMLIIPSIWASVGLPNLKEGSAVQSTKGKPLTELLPVTVP